MKNVDDIEKVIKIKFEDKKLLETAFVHKSYLNEHKSIETHNERLEFLGDAVLELSVTDHLYKNYDNPEGELTNWRAALVKGESISMVANKLGFEKFLLLSKGEQVSQGKAKSLILANVFESVIGAIYLDQGYEIADKFIHENLIVNLGEILDKKLHIDPKSHLQELMQKSKGVTPNYEVIKESGPDHEKEFIVVVKSGSGTLGKGKGNSKQKAEISAAADAVAKLGVKL